MLGVSTKFQALHIQRCLIGDLGVLFDNVRGGIGIVTVLRIAIDAVLNGNVFVNQIRGGLCQRRPLSIENRIFSYSNLFLIEEINSTQNKDARIQSLQPFVKNGYIKFSKKHKTLLKQMTEYPMGKNDDAPDGLQMAVKLALDVKIGRRVDYRSVIARALDFRRGAY